jgi:hypothetical protein
MFAETLRLDWQAGSVKKRLPFASFDLLDSPSTIPGHMQGGYRGREIKERIGDLNAFGENQKVSLPLILVAFKPPDYPPPWNASVLDNISLRPDCARLGFIGANILAVINKNVPSRSRLTQQYNREVVEARFFILPGNALIFIEDPYPVRTS